MIDLARGPLGYGRGSGRARARNREKRQADASSARLTFAPAPRKEAGGPLASDPPDPTYLLPSDYAWPVLPPAAPIAAGVTGDDLGQHERHVGAVRGEPGDEGF